MRYWISGYIIKTVFFSVSTSLSHHCAYTILEEIRLSLCEKLLKTNLGFVLEKPIGKLKDIIIDRVELIELPLAHLIPEGIGYTVLPLVVFVYLLLIDWRMALSSIATFPIGIITSGPIMNKINKQYNTYMQTNNYMNSVIVEYVEGIHVIKAFNQSERSYTKYNNAVIKFRDFTLKWYRGTWKAMSLIMAIMPSTLTVVVPIGLLLVKDGQLTPQDMAVCIILALGLVTPLMGLSGYMNSLKVIEYAVEETEMILSAKELEENKQIKNITSYNIEFKNVQFSYSQEDKRKALDNFNLKCKEGTVTALVGPSGSGKSTVARLLDRFWDIDAGSITIGGIDIRDVPMCQLTNLLSFVDQNNFLFNCSLMENIRIGKPFASDEEVYAAAKNAECDEFIKSLEHGYATKAGEAGQKLSGGEKQRIALARMMLKKAPIIILDEATSFMDPENEAKIQKALNKLIIGKTVIIIAHRLSTIKEADQIVVLEKGVVVSHGKQEELIKCSPLYKKMWSAHVRSAKWAANTALLMGGENV